MAPAARVACVLTQGRDNHWPHMTWQNVLASHRQDAGAVRMSQREDRAEIQVVREDYVTVGKCPRHDGRILGPRITNRGPMHGSPTVPAHLFTQQINLLLISAAGAFAGSALTPIFEAF